MRRLIVLDDEPSRIAGFSASLQDTRLPIISEFHETSGSFIAAVRDLQAARGVVSLDHDLLLTDPKDGLDVTKEIIDQGLLTGFAFIVHSSNGEQATRMVGELELDGRKVVRVPPFGEGWVMSSWVPAVLRLLSAISGEQNV